VLASNNIDANDPSGPFSRVQRSILSKGGHLSGNHLILFEGKKHQIIKLDASVNVKPSN